MLKDDSVKILGDIYLEGDRLNFAFIIKMSTIRSKSLFLYLKKLWILRC